LEALPTLVQGVHFRLSSTVMAAALVLVAWLGARRRQWGFAGMLLGGIALDAFHLLWREHARDYYFAPLGVAGGFALVRLTQLVPRLGFVVLILGVVWNGWSLQHPPRRLDWQREMTMAGRFAGQFVPEGERIGSFNAGLIAWHHDGAVFNLDGVVNAPAFASLQRQELGEYLRRQGVNYLLDNPVQFALRGRHSNGRHFGGDFDPDLDLQEIARFVWPGDAGRPGTEHVSLYRRRSHGTAPLPLAGPRDLGPAPGGDRFIAWHSRPGVDLRLEHAPIVLGQASLHFVVQVPWPGAEPLRLYEGDVLVLEVTR
jgi:hypothetical protein